MSERRSSGKQVSLTLKKFDMKTVPSNASIVLLGKRNTGKSTLVKDTLYHHRNIPYGQVISPTDKANPFYSNFVPKRLIHPEYDRQIIKKFQERQERAKEKFGNAVGENKKDYRAFIILDDCLANNSWQKDVEMRSLLMNGRHYGIMLLITMQYPLGVGPQLRTNFDIIFILRENIIGNRKRIYDNYAGMFPSFESFCQVMDTCTEDYECLVINNLSQSNDITEQVFWYKADLHENYRLCHPQLWINNDAFLRGKLKPEEDEEQYDAKTFRPQKPNQPRLNVHKTVPSRQSMVNRSYQQNNRNTSRISNGSGIIQPSGGGVRPGPGPGHNYYQRPTWT